MAITTEHVHVAFLVHNRRMAISRCRNISLSQTRNRLIYLNILTRGHSEISGVLLKAEFAKIVIIISTWRLIVVSTGFAGRTILGATTVVVPVATLTILNGLSLTHVFVISVESGVCIFDQARAQHGNTGRGTQPIVTKLILI